MVPQYFSELALHLLKLNDSSYLTHLIDPSLN